MNRAAALELLRSLGVVVFTDTPGAGPSFVHAVAGEPVRGSWWGHPRGAEMFNLSNAVLDSGEAILVKLVAGKETFVHRALWPALARVVTDEGYRSERRASLSERARKLLEAIEAAPPLRLDEHAARAGVRSKEDRRALQEARRELERALLVRADDLHTDSGAHTSTLETWEAWVAREKLRAASGKLTREEAERILREACGPVATALDPPRKARRRTGRGRP